MLISPKEEREGDRVLSLHYLQLVRPDYYFHEKTNSKVISSLREITQCCNYIAAGVTQLLQTELSELLAFFHYNE